MPRRHWFPNRACALDFRTRNTPGSPQAQRGADRAALTQRARTRPVTLARSAAVDPPEPVRTPAAHPVTCERSPFRLPAEPRLASRPHGFDAVG